MVGGVWQEELDQSFLDLEKQIDVASVIKAASMLEVVVWDPAALKKVPLSVSSTPIESNHSGPNATIRGCWFMLELMGKVLAPSSCYVQCIIFDAHGSHAMIRRLLHGQLHGISMQDIEKIEFFKDLSWKPLPTCILPRLPIQVCLHQDQPLFGIPGVCCQTAFVCICMHLFMLVS